MLLLRHGERGKIYPHQGETLAEKDGFVVQALPRQGCRVCRLRFEVKRRSEDSSTYPRLSSIPVEPCVVVFRCQLPPKGAAGLRGLQAENDAAGACAGRFSQEAGMSLSSNLRESNAFWPRPLLQRESHGVSGSISSCCRARV